MAAVIHFFARKRPTPPRPWPSVTLLQPITRGADSLRVALEARAGLDYAAHIQHLLVCDASDVENQSICRHWTSAYPHMDAQIVYVESSGGTALKTVKLMAGLPRAQG